MRFCYLVYHLLYLISWSYGEDDNIKKKMADAIIRKLYNLTTNNIFANGTVEERNNAWNIFEDRLKAVSQKRYGPDTGKYIDLIMHGIKAMSSNVSPRLVGEPHVMRKNVNTDKNNGFKLHEGYSDNTVDEIVNAANFENKKESVRSVALKLKNIVDSYNDKTDDQTIHVSNTENKQAVVKKITNKLKTLAEGLYDKNFDQKHIIESIKQKVMNMILKKHPASKGQRNVKELGRRLSNVIEMVVHTVISNFSKVQDNGLRYDKSEAESYLNKVNEEKTKDRDSSVMVMRDGNSFITDIPFYDDFKGVTSTVNCDALTDKVCTALKFTNKLLCPLDGKKISVERLCDGVNDCVDRHDERNCIRQAIDKIKDARRLISHVEESVIKNCANTHVDNTLLSKQSDILGAVLQSELNFLKRHAGNNSDDNFGAPEVVKKTVNEVAMVLSSLSTGLEGSLCPRYYGQDEEDVVVDQKNVLSLTGGDKNDPFEDLNPQSTPARSTLANKCVCDKGFCSDINCSQMCHLVCWQKHSLGHWGCVSVDGSTTVSLNVLCDGKTDCYDHSDEEDCSVGDLSRFQAITIYDDVLTDLALKAQAADMKFIRNNLLSLRASVSYLQKVTTQARPQLEHVKTVRDLCFSTLISTYNKVLSKGNIQSLDDIHHYLLTLNQKLISALKRSHTGNDKIVTLEGCYCSKNRCTLAKCSKQCERACAVESRLIKYSCDGTSKSAVFVPSNALCNGKENCPRGEDEVDCKKESCRAHHLVVLRHDLNRVGDKERGTALGAVLDAWKTKMETTLRVAEGSGRPTLSMVREVIDSLTRDLVATYSAIQSNKNENVVFKTFFDLSQRVLRVLKTCQ